MCLCVCVHVHAPRAGMRVCASNNPRSRPRLPLPPFSARSAEKASWLGLARNSAGTGQWRPARCKLVEEEEGCLLNIYVDVSRPQASMYAC